MEKYPRHTANSQNEDYVHFTNLKMSSDRNGNSATKQTMSVKLVQRIWGWFWGWYYYYHPQETNPCILCLIKVRHILTQAEEWTSKMLGNYCKQTIQM